MSELQLSLPVAEAGEELELEVVDATLVEAPAGLPASLSLPLPSPPPFEPSSLAARNLFAEAQRIAARAASASTRRQYGVWRGSVQD